MGKAKFVFSSKGFETMREAEEKATGYLQAGQLDQKMRLYKVVKVYKPVVKFKEIKQ